MVSANTFDAVSGDSRFTVSLLTRASEQSWVKLQSVIRHTSPGASMMSSSMIGTVFKNAGATHLSVDFSLRSRQCCESAVIDSNASSAFLRKSSLLAFVRFVFDTGHTPRHFK